MSLFGAMNTAIGGLNAQSVAFGNISDNVANSQTAGYKRVDTSFMDYLTTSTATVNEPGTVVARPDYVNTVPGTISQTDNTLAMAITGQGFFTVSHPAGTDVNGNVTFAPQSYYSRAGDFSRNDNGYLTNGSGEYLNGWLADPVTGVLDRSTVKPIQVAESVYKPVATQNLVMGANLPTGAIKTVALDASGNVTKMYDSSGAQVSAIQPQVQIYDAQGVTHTVQYTWTPQPSATANPDGSYDTVANTWTLQAKIDGTDMGKVTVTFAKDGTLSGISSSGTPVASSTSGKCLITYDTGLPTTTGTQSITLDLGTIGQTNGVTQFSSTYTLRGLTQDGVPPGSFSSLTTTSSGDIYANYDNGQNRLIARVPIATFPNADALQRQNGSSFTVTTESGNPSLQDAGTNGAGTLVTKAVEGSNVDIASEFSKLIVAQRTYSANTKMVTTADELLQQTIDMKR
ncbi:Flagellar hook protein FlgE [Rhodovastum atsumiense]|uniref:Flagellar hook protein FlgE n=1 Tax=Rhodovastum atsumiense TaxID=504468 RepID=A0A5M6IYM1_9PROT|nr:flagellar hook-basal body complex protein [Rhodovastum atsumiense]KAA5612468.1 flagellar hook-basal body complex protein [Rhodovastum atsumiense]CAH2600380.1 Flagellar hook protein FlgE [Rhodovastum atsumiense]